MTAQELIETIVYKGRQPFARVVVARGRAASHYFLKPGDTVPEEDHETSVFIHVDGVV